MRQRKSERGAILIFTAISIFVVMGLAAFAVDQGVRLMARAEAQNAADAGALAGAIALAYDGQDVSPSGMAYKSAIGAAGANALVFNPSVGIHVDVDPAATWELPRPAVCGTVVACVQVDIYADGSHGSGMIPSLFANLFNITHLPTRATATAMAAAANTENCLRPFMIPDKWQELGGDPNSFDPGIDVYTLPPVAPDTTPGSGYKVPDDVGTVVTLFQGDPHSVISPSDYYAVDVVAGATGGANFKAAIESCAMSSAIINTERPIVAADCTDFNCLSTEPGGMKGPAKQGAQALIDQDLSAYWNGTQVVNSNGSDGGSPRIVPIAMFSPDYFANLDRTSGRFVLPIVNMLGFFIQSVDSNATITGVLVRTSGSLSPGALTPGIGANFISIPLLVR